MLMLSSLASPMKPQVFITAMSPCISSGLWYTLNPCSLNWFISCSESTRFFEHPMVMMSTLRIVCVVIFRWRMEVLWLIVCLDSEFLSFKERFHEFSAVEGLEIGHLFAQSDVLHRYIQLMRNTDDYAALSRTIKFCYG